VPEAAGAADIDDDAVCAAAVVDIATAAEAGVVISESTAFCDAVVVIG
jgi:hypothetical protein